MKAQTAAFMKANFKICQLLVQNNSVEKEDGLFNKLFQNNWMSLGRKEKQQQRTLT